MQQERTPTPMKTILSENGINLEEIRKEYHEDSGEKEIITSSKEYIVEMCRMDNESIWDVVNQTIAYINKAKYISAYQKRMSKASLLLAWEELERDDFKLTLELWQNSRKKIN